MKGVICYWNRGAEALYGWPEKDALGKVAREFLKAVFPLPFEEIEAELLRTGRWEGELVKTTKDGTQLVVASRWSLKRDDRGEPIVILVTSNDITERKRAEEALHRSNRQLRAISNCNQALLRATDEQSLLEEICSIVHEEAGYTLAWVGYAERDDATSVRPVAWRGFEAGFLATVGITWADTGRGQGPAGTAIRSGQTCCIQDFATDPRLVPWRESVLQHGFLSGIGLPLKDKDADAFGCLTIYSAQPNTFTAEEVRLLEELAGDLAFGIVTLRSGAARRRAEQEVALLNFALDNVTDSAFLIDDRARFHYVNEEACRVLDYTRAELLRLGVSDIDPEFPEERWADHWRDLKAHRSLSFESRHRTRDGRIFPVEVGANYFEYGGRAYNLALARDITERKRAEESLRESDERFRIAFENAGIGMALVHMDGHAINCNPALEKMLGYSEEELRGMVFTEFTVPDDRELDWGLYRELIRGDRDKYEIQKRYITKDGRVIWGRLIVSLVRDAHGTPQCALSTIEDFTERKRAEEALRRSEAYLAEGQRLSHTGSWASDKTTTPLYWSEELLRIFGFDPQNGFPTRGEALQRIHPGDVDRFWSAFQRAIQQKVDSDLEYRILLPDGTVKHVYGLAHPLLNAQGDLVEVVGTVVDITERKRAEEESRRLRELEADLAHTNRISMLGELTASVAHELKQPIAAAALHAETCLQWLRRDQPNLHEAGEAATRIIDDATTAVDIIDRLRSLYKKSPPKRELVDVNQTIRQMVALLLGEANRRAVSIRAEVAEGLPQIHADAVQIQQVLMNLMLNGIEAMHDTGGVLAVKSQLTHGGRVEISVSDTGVGLPAGKADHIFNAFFTTKAQGSGMGLSISRSIVESHGGHIWATGNDRRGASFHFALPIAAEAPVPAAVS